jgi:hypothetical protein
MLIWLLAHCFRLIQITRRLIQITRTVNGEFELCKTRIVAGGDHQEYGVIYTDTYAPAIDWTILRPCFYIVVCFLLGKSIS